VGGEAVRGKVTPSRTFEKIGEEPGQIAAFRVSFFISHEYRTILQGWSAFAITAVMRPTL
jgi:hypothetical protein